MDEEKKDRYWIKAFFLNFLLALIAFLGILVQDKGLFTLCNDFNEQQIPFMMFMNKSIKSGEIFWNWNIDLGSDFIGAMSYYSLGSPFFWITLLFPANAYIYVTAWIYMLKYAVAGASSYLFFVRFTKDKKYALLGSVLYAFSGFQTVNLLFGSFHDTVAFFPFMLIGIEKITEEHKRGYFALAVFLNALVNYYFFTQEVLFVVMYFLIKNGVKKWKEMLTCFLEGIFGIGMAGILLVPSLYSVLENPRINSRLQTEAWFDFGRRHILQLLRVFLFPGEVMGKQSCIYQDDWSSWSAYLPGIGMTLVLSYMWKKKKSWISRFLLILFIFSYIPLLNSIFGFLSESNYHRWYFMMIMIMCLASVKVLEERNDYPVVLFAGAIGVFMCIMTAAFPWWDEHKFELIFKEKDFYFLSLLAIIGVVAVVGIAGFVKKEKQYYFSMLTMVSLFGIVTTGYMCNGYKGLTDVSAQEYYESLMMAEEIAKTDNRYRFDVDDNKITMIAPLCGVGSFDSTVNGSIFEFWKSLGEKRGVFSPEGPDGTKELLSVKYEITQEERSDSIPVQKIIRENKRLYIYERENAIPIGTTYHDYLLKSEFERMDNAEKSKIMLQTLIVPDEREEEVKGYLEHKENLESLSIEQLLAKHADENSEKLEKSKEGFSSIICCEKKGYAYFSVPFAKNWRAAVNGKNVEIINTNGMMAIPVEKGANEIVFDYKNTEKVVGIIVSLTAFFGFALYIYYSKNKMAKNSDKIKKTP